MKTIADLIRGLEEIKMTHGNITLAAEYWCPDCHDYHTGKGLELSVSDNVLHITVVRLGFGEDTD